MSLYNDFELILMNIERKFGPAMTEAEKLHLMAEMVVKMQKKLDQKWAPDYLSRVFEISKAEMEKSKTIDVKVYETLSKEFSSFGAYWRQEVQKFPEIKRKGKIASVFYHTNLLANLVPQDDWEKTIISNDGLFVTGPVIQTDGKAKRHACCLLSFVEKGKLIYNIGSYEGTEDMLQNGEEPNYPRAEYKRATENFRAFSKEYYADALKGSPIKKELV